MRYQSLLAWAERIAETGSWEYVPSDGELLWSDNLYRIFGAEPGEVQPSFEYLLERTHVDDRQRLYDAVEALVERGETSPGEYRFTRPDGDRRHLRATLAVTDWRGERPYRMVGVLHDVTDRRRAEREIAAHVAVQEALVAWKEFQPGADGLLARLGDALDCCAGVFWVPLDDVLVPRVVWHERAGESDFELATRARPTRLGSGLAGRAWEAGKPLSWTLGGQAATDPPDAADRSAGISGAVAIPAIAGEEVLAVVELLTDREIRVGDRLTRSLYGIAHELGHFLARRGGELAAPLLTAREIEMLQLAADGHSARESAARSTVSPATVRSHLENIYRKLEVSDKASAVATALRLGLID